MRYSRRPVRRAVERKTFADSRADTKVGYEVSATPPSMKSINWNPEKNREIIENRGISFEDIVFCLRSGGLLDDMAHPNTVKYSHQRVLVVAVEGYAYLVPYVEDDREIFLKTVIPSRKATKQYLGDKK